MQQEPRYSKEFKQEMVLAALNSLGPIPKGFDFAELEMQVADRVAAVSGLLVDSTVPMRIMEASKIYAIITGAEVEERSNRGIIHFRAANAENGEEETIRTGRLEKKQAQIVFDTAKAKIGQWAMIYKKNEPMRGAPDRNVRVAIYVR